MSLSLATCLPLRQGGQIPQLGLGVYQSPAGEVTRQAVSWALQAGYRHIDTASLYANEADVGAALQQSGLPRSELFVTTKVWNSDQGYEPTLKAFQRSLKLLGLEYLDLYLIHFPVPGLRRESWRALEKLQQEGYCREIGVSNYTVRHLHEMEVYAHQLPAVNQVEFSPYLYQKHLLQHCQARGIQLTAYSPLTQGQKFGDPPLVQIASKHRKSPAQVLIRWALQHQLVVIPKSVTQARIQQNADVFDFELDAEDLAVLDKLNQDFRVCWDPSAVE